MRPVSAKHRVAVIAAENTFKSPSRCQIINYENTIFYSILCSSHIIILIKYRIGMWLWFWCCVSFQGRHTFSDCFNALTGRSSQIASILTGFSGKYICYQTVEQMEDHLEQMVERMRRGNLVCISV